MSILKAAQYSKSTIAVARYFFSYCFNCGFCIPIRSKTALVLGDTPRLTPPPDVVFYLRLSLKLSY